MNKHPFAIKLTVIYIIQNNQCSLFCCVYCDICVAITCFLSGLSTVAMLCGNVLGLSNCIVSSLCPCSRNRMTSFNMCVKCV